MIEMILKEVLNVMRELQNINHQLVPFLEGINKIQKDTDEIKKAIGKSEDSLVKVLGNVKDLMEDDINPALIEVLEQINNAIALEKKEFENIRSVISYVDMLKKSEYSSEDIIGLGKAMKTIEKIGFVLEEYNTLKGKIVFLVAAGGIILSVALNIINLFPNVLKLIIP